MRKMSDNKDGIKMKPKISFVQLGKEENKFSAASIATGCPTLDTLLFGGGPQKFTVALTSPMCDERDQLIRCFLKKGAENNEPTFFVNIEPSIAGTIATEHPSNVYLFVCNSLGESMIEKASNICVLKGR